MINSYDKKSQPLDRSSNFEALSSQAPAARWRVVVKSCWRRCCCSRPTILRRRRSDAWLGRCSCILSFDRETQAPRLVSSQTNRGKVKSSKNITIAIMQLDNDFSRPYIYLLNFLILRDRFAETIHSDLERIAGVDNLYLQRICF